MKVQVTYTIDIDAEAWRNEFGSEDVRADVKARCEYLAVEQVRMDGLLSA